MKAMISAVLIFCFFGVISADITCPHGVVRNITTKWVDMEKTCENSVAEHVNVELKAALQYLAMGSHFSKYNINRPGFAKMFFDAATEEREHAMKFIQYLLMRGELTKNAKKIIDKIQAPQAVEWKSGNDALRGALELENQVTNAIRDLIKLCEDSNDVNDYHLVDYLTGEFLEEQYRGQRDLAGKITTLEKMMRNHGALGEFLFDKKLLE